MKSLVDAFWRAAAYCLHPKLILGSLAPVLIAGGAVFGLGWLYWEPAVDAVRQVLDQWTLADAAFGVVEKTLGLEGVRAFIAPAVVVSLGVPLVVVLSLLLVAMLMMPVIIEMVAKRRFPNMERKHGAGWFQTTMWSLLCTIGATLTLVVTLPLWLVPPLALVLPPLIWGWLTYRVFTFEVLAGHASTEERRELMRRHRGELFAMGIVSGYMGAAPTLVWAFSAFTLVFAPLLLVVSVWLYTLVFAFAAAWFAHYALAALQRLRADNAVPTAATTPVELLPAAAPQDAVVLPPPRESP
ncbi:MAG: EI24 domain-containing protein [Rubrivivax sp.]|nr:EI24 domain-containing protein [Rubrivivax sp.]MDH5339649.1 EI24 domain-containing protein [Rubrivivax sp.]